MVIQVLALIPHDQSYRGMLGADVLDVFASLSATMADIAEPIVPQRGERLFDLHFTTTAEGKCVCRMVATQPYAIQSREQGVLGSVALTEQFDIPLGSSQPIEATVTLSAFSQAME